MDTSDEAPTLARKGSPELCRPQGAVGAANIQRQFLLFIAATLGMVASSLTLPVLNHSIAMAAGGTTTVLRRWGATMGGSQAITAGQAVTDAQNVDTLVGLPGTLAPYTAQMRAANSALKLIYYLNGVYAAQANATYPESLYLHDATGSRVYSRNFNNPLMDASNPAWVQSRVDDCKNTLASIGWDGCYLDMLGPGTLTPGYLTAQPINPATGAVWTTPEWIAVTTKLAATVSSSLPSATIVGNGLENGNPYTDPTQGPTVDLLNGLVAGNAQSFVRGDQDPATAFRRESQWKADVDMLIDAGHRNRSVLAQAKVWATGTTQTQKNALHRYTLATFLLGTDGKQEWYFSATGQESAVVPDSPYDHVNVGTPVESYAKKLGAYQRRYTGGLVVVNPTSAAVTIPLASGQWTTLGGTVVQGQITLAANTGDVLSTSTAVGAVPAVTTGVVSNITPTSATVTGSVNPNGLATTVQAEYGTDSTLGTLSAPISAGSGTTRGNVQVNLTGLIPGATYVCHLDATSSAGTVAGANLTFTVPLPAPTVRTSSAVVNGPTAATVSGYVNPNGLATTYYVDFGLGTSYGRSSAMVSAGSGTTLINETVPLTGLSSGSLVHYRFTASNSTGTSSGLDRTVRMP